MANPFWGQKKYGLSSVNQSRYWKHFKHLAQGAFLPLEPLWESWGVAYQFSSGHGRELWGCCFYFGTIYSQSVECLLWLCCVCVHPQSGSSQTGHSCALLQCLNSGELLWLHILPLPYCKWDFRPAHFLLLPLCWGNIISGFTWVTAALQVLDSEVFPLLIYCYGGCEYSSWDYFTTMAEEEAEAERVR